MQQKHFLLSLWKWNQDRGLRFQVIEIEPHYVADPGWLLWQDCV